LMIWGRRPSSGNQPPPNPPSGQRGDCVRDYIDELFRLAVLLEGHIAVYGPTGAGKTKLIENALRRGVPTHGIVVLDIAGNYEGYTDYYAPYPLNVVGELSPVVLPSVLAEVFEIAGEVNAITPTMARNLEVLAAWLLGLQPPPQGLDVSRYPRTLGGLIKLAEDAVNVGVIQGNLVESVYALIRRLSMVGHWMVDYETHPIIRRLLSGELRGKSIGIDLSVFEDAVQRWFYVIALLRALGRVRDVIVVIDEAHLFLRREASTLTQFVKVGRNFGRYAVLVTQSPNDLPDWLPEFVKLSFEFPIPYLSTRDMLIEYPSYKYLLGDREPGVRPSGELPAHWRSPHTAKVRIVSTNEWAFECYGEGLTIDYVKVDVRVQPKPEAITLRKCAEKYGVPVDLIREYGFDVRSRGETLRGVWECIGSP